MIIKNKNTKKIVLLCAVIFLAIAAGGWFLLRNNNQQPNKNVPETTEDIDYSPPNEDEIKAGEQDNKTLNPNTPTASPPTDSSPQRKTVRVNITSWGSEGTRFEVSAYANIFESAGKCNVTLKKGATTLKGSSQAVQNASTMSCGALSVDRTKVSSGIWDATVTYTSSKYYGSLTRKIEVE